MSVIYSILECQIESIKLVFHQIEIELFRLNFGTHNKNENNKRETLPKRKEKQSNILLLKQSNTTHFQTIKQSSSPTIKHNNQRETTTLTNPIPTWGFARIGLHRFCWSWLDRIGGSLSLCLVPYLTFPTEAFLSFAQIGSDKVVLQELSFA